jgi:hypothetical protein
METLAFLTAATGSTLLLNRLRRALAASKEERAARATAPPPPLAPLVTVAPSDATVESFAVPHMRDYFPDTQPLASCAAWGGGGEDMRGVARAVSRAALSLAAEIRARPAAESGETLRALDARTASAAMRGRWIVVGCDCSHVRRARSGCVDVAASRASVSGAIDSPRAGTTDCADRSVPRRPSRLLVAAALFVPAAGGDGAVRRAGGKPSQGELGRRRWQPPRRRIDSLGEDAPPGGRALLPL